MRKIESHKVNPANDVIEILVLDEPGQGGACHNYDVRIPLKGGVTRNDMILFQDGPIAEVGVNGLTHEVLLAILADRLEHFQKGKFANEYNAEALEHIRAAQAALHRRTQERVSRGVEGTHTV